MYKVLTVLSDGVNQIVRVLLFLLTTSLIALTFLGVAVRFLLNMPIIWLYELTIVLFAWMIFTGVSLAFYNCEHVSIDFLEQYLQKINVDKILRIIIKVAILIFLFFGIACSFQIVKSTYMCTYQTVPISMAIFYASFFVNAIFSSVHLLRQLVGEFVSNREVE